MCYEEGKQRTIKAKITQQPLINQKKCQEYKDK